MTDEDAYEKRSRAQEGRARDAGKIELADKIAAHRAQRRVIIDKVDARNKNGV